MMTAFKIEGNSNSWVNKYLKKDRNPKTISNKNVYLLNKKTETIGKYIQSNFDIKNACRRI